MGPYLYSKDSLFCIFLLDEYFIFSTARLRQGGETVPRELWCQRRWKDVWGPGKTFHGVTLFKKIKLVSFCLCFAFLVFLWPCFMRTLGSSRSQASLPISVFLLSNKLDFEKERCEIGAAYVPLFVLALRKLRLRSGDRVRSLTESAKTCPFWVGLIVRLCDDMMWCYVSIFLHFPFMLLSSFFLFSFLKVISGHSHHGSVSD